jgi:hypothetical protein
MTPYELLSEDQADRKDHSISGNAGLLTERDTLRRQAVRELIQSNELTTADDFYYASMIFHHGNSIEDSERAMELSKKAIDLGHEKAKRMYALCIDRYLIKQGKLQKFGTQYHKRDANSMWEMIPLDPNTTDEERRKYDVESLEQLKEHINKLNNKS